MTCAFEFRTTRKRIKMSTREMADYSAIMRHLHAHNAPYHKLDLQPMKPMKAVIRQLPGDTPAEDTSNEVATLGYSVISVRQMTAILPQPQGGYKTFSVTCNEKFPDIFKLTCPGHIVIKAEEYRAQAGLTQCYNCQKFGHVWAKWRPPPSCCLW
jgi:hypothetical protein